MKKVRISFLWQVVIAIALGIALGQLLPTSVVRVFITICDLFNEFLSFTIPLIIVGLVSVAIADIGSRAGKMLLTTLALAYGFTLFSGFLSYATCEALFPSIIDTNATVAVLDDVKDVKPYFHVSIPPVMDVMSALFFSFILGMGCSAVGSTSLKGVLQDFQQIIMKLITRIIIPLLPLFIFGVFLNMTHTGQAMAIMIAFLKVILVIFLIHIVVLVVQFTIAGVATRRNPFKMMWTMFPAYMTACATFSSAATIPVTLEQVKKNGVSDEVADFAVPLCANIHLSGSTLKIVAITMALLVMHGMPHGLDLYVGFIFMLGIIMVAAPGVPGGAMMSALGIISSMLGLGMEDQALLIGLNISMSHFGTACNVTGDGAIAVIINKYFGKSKQLAAA